MEVQEKKYRNALNQAQAEKDYIQSMSELKKFLENLEDEALGKAIDEAKDAPEVSLSDFKKSLNIR